LKIHCGNCGIADDAFHVTDEDCERARQKEDKMIVWVFEHEVAYEGSMDLRIFSTMEKAQRYGEKYKEWHPDVWDPFPEWLPRVDGGCITKELKSREWLTIRPYEVE